MREKREQHWDGELAEDTSKGRSRHQFLNRITVNGTIAGHGSQGPSEVVILGGLAIVGFEPQSSENRSTTPLSESVQSVVCATFIYAFECNAHRSI